ncbi:MAG: hypothetical protein QW756_02190 [Nitrososphaerota archaeon]
MRAQLSIIVLIAFGAGLVALGLIRFPYTTAHEDDVLVQTSSTEVQTVVETGTIVLTYIRTSSATSHTTLQVVETYTTTRLTSATTVLNTIGPRRAWPETPIILGPYTVDLGEKLRILWTADRPLNVYVMASNITPPTTWLAVGEGAVGNLTYTTSAAENVYVGVYASEPDTTISGVEVIRLADVPNVEMGTRTSTVTTALSYTTTHTIYEAGETTVARLETARIPYTTLVRTTVTETRYSDVGFAAFMGSFIIFTGILLMVLLVRVMPKPHGEVNRPEG